MVKTISRLFRSKEFKRQPIILLISSACMFLLIAYLVVLSNFILKLSNAWLESKTTLTNQNQLIEVMISEIGYTGYIHHFKNYVIRRDDKYLDWMDDSFNKFNQAVAKLDESLLSNDAKQAVKTISDTINEYESKRIYFGSEYKDHSPNELDALVKVDDGPAALAKDELISFMVSNSVKSAQAIQQKQQTVQTFLKHGGIVMVVAMFLQTLVIFNGFARSRKLTVSLNRALKKVTTSEKMLHASNTQLEKRVKERTSELEMTAQKADHANQAKSNFLAMMSHELRTPMNAVVGSLDLLAHEKLNFNQADLVATAKSSALGLVTILNDILDFSKIEMGRLEIEPKDINLYQVIHNVVSVFLPVAESKNVRLVVNQSHLLPMVVNCDEVRIRQILSNLLSNAIKFTHSDEQKQGEVVLHCFFEKTEKDTGKLRFSVTDTGIGISEDSIQKLFKPFTQAELSTQRKYGGTGLGLSICQSICDLLNGSIELTSKLGEGTKVDVSIPYIPPMNADDRQLLDKEKSVVIWDFADDHDHPKTKEMLLFLLEHNISIVRPEDYQSNNTHNISILFTGNPDIEMSRFENTPVIVFLEDYKACKQITVKDENHLFYGLNELTFWKLYHLINRSVEESASRQKKAIEALEDGFADLFGNDGQSHSEKSAHDTDKAIKENTLILVVEDNPVNLKLISRQLKMINYEYVLASDGVEGLAKLKDHKVTLILSDCHMPNLNGFDMTKQIRSMTNGKQDIPIIAITGAAMKEDEELCYQAGMDSIIKKPFQLTELKEAIERFTSS